MNEKKEPYVGMPIYLDDPDGDRNFRDQRPQSGRTENVMEGLSLAMAYVPWQQWNETYSPEKAFGTGTVFPELDMPFKGGMR